MTVAGSAVMIASTSFGAFSTGTTSGTTAAAPTRPAVATSSGVAPASASRSVAGSQQALPAPGQARPRGSLLDISA